MKDEFKLWEWGKFSRLPHSFFQKLLLYFTIEASTTIKHMLAGNKILVSTYQIAYLWDAETDINNVPKQVNLFFMIWELCQECKK